jgi:MYXO-CTERM domain-containing protein
MLAIGAIWGVTVIAVSTPISTAQVGVPYSSSCTASGGTAPYTYSISAGALPGGLAINSSTGAIAGTPTTAGQFSFTCFITDSFQPVLTGANPGEAAARSGGIAKAGSPQATASSNFTITVASAPSPTPVPPSIWMAAMGLAGAGLARRRQMRRG